MPLQMQAQTCMAEGVGRAQAEELQVREWVTHPSVSTREQHRKGGAPLSFPAHDYRKKNLMTTFCKMRTISQLLSLWL